MAGAFDPGAFGSAFDAEAQYTFTLDAVLRREQTGSLTLDAILRIGRSGTFTLDAEITRNFFSLDAILFRTQAGSFTLDSVLKRSQTGSLTADAVLRRNQTGSFTADAVLKRSQTGSLTANAVKRKTISRTLTANAWLRREQSGSFTADAYLAFHRIGSLTADAVKRVRQSGSLVVRAAVANNEAAVAVSSGVTQVHIRVNGADITDDVIFSDATFTTFVNGAVGSFRFRVKDTDRTRSFTSGDEITLDIDGIRRFGGYLLQPTRSFFFEVEDTSDVSRVARVLTFAGVDYNILFQKRAVYDKARPANVALRSWAVGTQDDTIIKYVFDHYTDLFADGFTRDGVEHVGFPNPDRSGVVGSGGLTVGDLMRETNRLIGAVWYFSPSKDLTWTDVDTPNASKSLSDNPVGGSEIGYREFSRVSNGSKLANDALVWGAAQGVDHLTFGRHQDATSIAAHRRWQYGEFTSQLYKQASVNLRASTVVDGTPQNKRGGKDDQVSWLVATYDAAFVIGQKVTIESEVFGKSDTVPIRKMTITFPTKTTPRFEMMLSHEIDEAWNTFEYVFPRISISPFDIQPISIPPIETLGGDPTIPVCWVAPPSLIDNLNRAFVSPDPGLLGIPLSDVGCTSWGSYPWFGDNLSDITDTQLNGGLNGGLSTSLNQSSLTDYDYDPGTPNPGSWTVRGSGQWWLWLPVDGKNFRLEFTLAMTQGGDFDHNPPNNDYRSSYYNQNRAYCSVSVRRFSAPFQYRSIGPDTGGFGALSDGIGFDMYDIAGTDGVAPWGAYAFLNGNGGIVNNATAILPNKLGGAGTFGGGVGVVLIRSGDSIQLTVGALTLTDTIITDESVGPGESYIGIGIDFELDNAALDWGPNGPSQARRDWWTAHPSGSFTERLSGLRLITDEGNCVDVPPHNTNPDWNGPCQ